MPMKPSSVKSPLPAETWCDVAVARAHQPVDQPGLAAELGGHPAGRVGDVGEGHGSIRIQSSGRDV